MQASSRRDYAILIPALFVLLCALILISTWPVIQSAGFESSDFAANSVLIQSAKRLTLLTGNYSRVGFSHPGPAILYVLALGEVLFHDLTNLVRSPVGGQLVAVTIYAAGWLTWTAASFRRLGAGNVATLVFACAMPLLVAAQAPESLNGLWFPHLYVMPFACLTLALMLIVVGDTAGLLPFAVQDSSVWRCTRQRPGKSVRGGHTLPAATKLDVTCPAACAGPETFL